jgi:hypothetical protein
MDIAIKLILVAVIVEYFTSIFYGQGVFATLFGGWDFDPIIADHGQIKAIAKRDGIDNLPEAAVMRALEVAGYIGLMLSGAFPMVYLMKKYLAVPMETVGKKVGLSPTGAAGILGAAANILAMFRLIRDMPPKDKVLNIAFAVCAAFTFGDHLAFTANFQPNLLVSVILGKLTGGCFAFWLAYRLSVPKALELEKREMEAKVRAACAEVPVLRGKDLILKELGGGLTNVNYKVSAEGVGCVVRIFGENTQLLGIDRIREVECQSAAAAAGVAPQVIASLPQHRALVTQFIDGKVLTSADAHRPENLRRIAKALRRCHDHPVESPIGAFSAFDVIRQYHQLARERRARLPAELPECLAILEGIENELKDGPASCMCHNDLLAENLIDRDGTLTKIDWEYGGLGDQ